MRKICMFCGEVGREILNSHVIPAGVYRRIDAVPIKVDSSSMIAKYDTAQLRGRYFFRSCEDRFKITEDCFYRYVDRPSAELLIAENSGEAIFINCPLDDQVVLAKFFLGVLWRCELAQVEGVRLNRYSKIIKSFLKDEVSLLDIQSEGIFVIIRYLNVDLRDYLALPIRRKITDGLNAYILPMVGFESLIVLDRRASMSAVWKYRVGGEIGQISVATAETSFFYGFPNLKLSDLEMKGKLEKNQINGKL